MVLIADDAPPRDQDRGRNETSLERVDRNTTDLLNELRVAGTGVQVLFAFLLTVPFSNGYKRMSPFDRTVYFVTLLSVAASAALLIAPSIHHRLLFARGEKPYVVAVGNRAAIAGIACLVIGFTGIVVVISNVMFGGLAATIAGGLTGLGIGGLWFAIPLRRRTLSTRRAGRRGAQRESR